MLSFSLQAARRLSVTSFLTFALLSPISGWGYVPAVGQENGHADGMIFLPMVAFGDGLDGTDVESLDSVSAFHETMRGETRYTLPDGSPVPSIAEYNYFWARSETEFGYNDHQITTLLDPRSGDSGVMDETYRVDDRVYRYCSTCPGQGGWSVSQRSAEAEPFGSPLDMDNVSLRVRIDLAALVAQSVVIGDEQIGGISATHYRLTDSNALSGTITLRTGPVEEITMAQMDIWLTVADRWPLQYTLVAEGNMEMVAGSQSFLPFSVQEQYSVTPIQ